MGACVIRAVHQLLDEKPPILEDPVSPMLIGDEGVREIREKPEKHKGLPARALRSHIVLRSRHAEDRLLNAVESGVTQFINVGAGYDTFSFRQPRWALGLRIVEIDQTATQRAKLEIIQRAKIPIPKNVEFLPLDLERQELTSAIAATGMSLSIPTFVACLGVLAYLRPETVHRIFASVARLYMGSSFVFAFASDHAEASQAAPSIATRTASLGEPWLTRFGKGELEAELTGVGFRRVSFLEPAEAAQKYYKGRGDLPAPRKTRLCEATV